MRFLVCCCLMLSASLLFAADKKKAYLNEKDGGEDFVTQGEYTGDVTTDGNKHKIGVQVIARGDGEFVAVGYQGGLPGDGWDGGERIQGEGKTVNGETKFGGDNVTAIVKDGTITIRNSSNDVVGELKKVVRQSPTLGEKAPEGAIVLFDGTNVEAWDPGKMEDEMLMGIGTRTKASFGNFKLHLEFRTPYMPYATGQGRGNSGMYLHDQYECQILDSFGLEGRDNECGGLYSISKPKLNMCFPPLSWQTYDVDMTAPKLDDQGNVVEPAKATIKLNGVTIHDNIALKITPGGGRSNQPAGPGPLFLQDHGNPVRFRNIWLVEK